MNKKRRFGILLGMFVLLIQVNVALAARPEKVTCPDLTQGQTEDELKQWRDRWN